MNQYKKEAFLDLPTPLTYLPQLSQELDISLYCKRDDLLPFGMGGNKLRKLEYFLAKAQEEKSTMLVTMGGAQTNHGRLTAAIASKYGLKCAILTFDPYPKEVTANLLLDGCFGAHVFFSPESKTTTEQKDYIKEKLWQFKEEGERPYYIPMGGSSPLGTLGYYHCALELEAQRKDANIQKAFVVSAVGSMGTYMGLYTGLKDIGSPLIPLGISIFPRPKGVSHDIKEFYHKVQSTFNYSFGSEDIWVTDDYHFGAYNNPVKEVRETIYYVARKEAILLDPCYTGKAFYGLLDLKKKGIIKSGESVIFLHTGGSPGLNSSLHQQHFEKELLPFMHF